MRNRNGSNLMHPFQKILWPIDAFDESGRAFEHMAALLRTLTLGKKVRIQPIYVLDPDQTNFPHDLFLKWADDYAVEAKELLTDHLKKANLENVAVPVVLMNKHGSTRSSITKLLVYARHHRFDLIVTSTYGRKGIARMLLGSFAETLLVYSDLPLLISNPAIKHSRAIKRLTVSVKLPFSGKSQFEDVIDLAKTLGSTLRIFHHTGIPVSHLEGVDKKRLIADLKKHNHLAQKEAQGLANLAERHGVTSEISVTHGRVDLVDSIIAEISKPSHELLVVFGQRKRAEGGDYGANVRKVAREFQGSVLFLPVASK